MGSTPDTHNQKSPETTGPNANLTEQHVVEANQVATAYEKLAQRVKEAKTYRELHEGIMAGMEEMNTLGESLTGKLEELFGDQGEGQE